MRAVEIITENLSKNMGGVYALDAVSAVFDPGLVHGVVGPNGSGKTTLLRVLAGLLHPLSGRVVCRADGRAYTVAEMKELIGYFPQEPSLYPDLSCEEHLKFFRDLYGLTDSEFIQRSADLLAATDMVLFKDRPAGKLSGGMYKKLGLMCVLLNRPKLLLLDEPTVGVDPVSRQELWDLVYGFSGPEMTVILSTSYMDEAQRCAKVHVLDCGKLLAEGKPSDLMEKFNVTDFAEIFLNHEHAD